MCWQNCSQKRPKQVTCWAAFAKLKSRAPVHGASGLGKWVQRRFSKVVVARSLEHEIFSVFSLNICRFVDTTIPLLWLTFVLQPQSQNGRVAEVNCAISAHCAILFPAKRIESVGLTATANKNTHRQLCADVRRLRADQATRKHWYANYTLQLDQFASSNREAVQARLATSITERCEEFLRCEVRRRNPANKAPTDNTFCCNHQETG